MFNTTRLKSSIYLGPTLMGHSYSNFEIPQSLGKEVQFFNLLVFEAKSDLNHKASKIMSNLTRASKQYLNDKCLINGQETTSIFLFSAENFELDFNYT